MTYLSRNSDPRGRAAALAATVAIHAVMGVVVVAGLAVSGVIPLEKGKLIGVNIPLTPPPPPPLDVVEMPKSKVQPPVAPNREIVLNTDSTQTVDVFDPAKPEAEVWSDYPDVRPTVTPPPLPPRPTPSFTPTGAAPLSSPASWITADDYPASPLRQGIEGTATYRLVIATSGKVSACEITASTGNRQLDAATCRALTRRARFEAATDGSGARVVGTYTGRVTWQIPD
ncbi:conserved hypothetical protein [Altererythrobacter sp. B11]|uniref:energy transducer TonB n=1 Tax=Altererythrobacter sp. B11 TaxID=2060312 RepID=UPI000DC6D252|nr:energy transducer TonB [Altererythrobacter sp. B11]BBC73747.1 conserved hypothetical protein [Altererythrobacter sp. B11]